MLTNGRVIIHVTKHAAGRIFERSSDAPSVLRALEVARESLLLHIYDCLVQGRPKRVVVGEHTFILFFEEVSKRMLLKTYYPRE